jgi:hypothetical protein
MSRCESKGEEARVSRNDLIRIGRIGAVGVGEDRWKSLVSYKSEIAIYFPSSEMVEEIKFVRNYSSVFPYRS